MWSNVRGVVLTSPSPIFLIIFRDAFLAGVQWFSALDSAVVVVVQGATWPLFISSGVVDFLVASVHFW